MAEVRYERVRLYKIRSSLRMVILGEGAGTGKARGGWGELEILQFLIWVLGYVGVFTF